MSQTSHISTSGGLISTAFIENIRQAQINQRGTQSDTFGLPWREAPKSPAALEARIAETWEALLERWDAIATELPKMDISQARDRWILPLLRALDFQPIYQRSDIVLDDSEALRFNISHFGWAVDEQGSEGAEEQGGISPPLSSTPALLLASSPPIHTVPPSAGLDVRTTGATNSRSPKGKSPHDMLQLFLNVSRGYRWAVLTNGLHLRLLRDYHHTYTKGYVEFDLESIFETRNFADFRALYRLAHASRFVGPVPTPELSETSELLEVSGQERWESAPLEMFYRDSQAAGIQVGADLQKQVREAIEMLGNGFLLSGGPLLRQLQADTALCQRFYAELLHIVYRILFLLYAEQRGMVPKTGVPLENLYRQGYSLTALRTKAESDPTSPEAYDLWEGLKVTFKMFQKGADDLGVYRYNGMLFAEDQTPLLDGRGAGEQRSGGDNSSLPQPLRCRNLELLRAIRALTLIEREGALQRISYADLNVEEIGGIYESLLDFAPRVTTGAEDVDGRAIPPNTFFLDPRGTARKTTGSYYTHPSLVNALIESALIPVLETRLAEGQGRGGAGEKASRGEKDSPLPLSTPAPLLLDPESRAVAEQAILSMKVCDPAMGSGHFLIAANNVLALRLAQVRTGDEYPAERELRRARRDVLAHCIYGVDLNPMAVELCKVALWINAAVDDAPLSFLDHHLKCGNSLIGTTPELLEQGIPNDAFQPVTSDDPKVASAVRKRNKKEREGQLSLWRMTVLKTLANLDRWRELNELAEAEPQIAERRYTEYRADPTYRHNKLVADLWTAAFFWSLDEDSDLIPTEELFRQAQADPTLLPGEMVTSVEELAQHSRFFHWHLEFPDVFEEDGKGGFDVVLGNPPWERIKLQEKEFFATRDQKVIDAPTAAARRKLITELFKSNPDLATEYRVALSYSECESKFLRNSEHFPLTSIGDINTYAIFSELARQLIAVTGRAGLVVPTGIATDFTYRDYFSDLIESASLVSLYDFENRLGIFPGVHRSYKFSLLTVAKKEDKTSTPHTEFSFFLQDADDLVNQKYRFTLTKEDFYLFNPNTRTCPIFRTQHDMHLTRKLYLAYPVLYNLIKNQNPWEVSLGTMFHSGGASNLFRSYQELIDQKMNLNPFNNFQDRSETYVKLYEGKMFMQYDHRAAEVIIDYSNIKRPAVAVECSINQKQKSDFFPKPRFWVSMEEVLKAIPELSGNYLVAFKKVTSPTNERTLLATILPFVAANDSIHIVFFPSNTAPSRIAAFLGNLNSIILDFVVRQKLGGVNLNFYVLEQLPILPPDRYTPELIAFIVPRVLELTYTAWDLRPFADDLWNEAISSQQSILGTAIETHWQTNRDVTNGGHIGVEPLDPIITKPQFRFPYPPFKWDEERRVYLRAELDGLYAYLYNLDREELAYILDTFPIVRRKDEERWGEYRTKRLVLEGWEKAKYYFAGA